MSTHMVKTILRGYHVYQVVWEAAVGQVQPCLLGREVFITYMYVTRFDVGVRVSFTSGYLFHLSYDTRRRNNR